MRRALPAALFGPRRPWWAAGFCIFGACVRPPPADETDVTLSPPAIATFAWSCDVELAAWTLKIEATSWSNGGALWLTDDGSYVERHPVRVTRDEPDGSGETLELELAIEADWRDVALGSSTAFLCADDPALRFVLDDRAGEPADCRSSGPPTAWADLPDVPPCDTPWQP